jgi:tetratricopeptide (TPR) repeat protein
LTANKAAADLYNQALELGAAGNYSRAMKVLTQAISINSHLTGAQLLAGQILYEQKKYKAASEAFKRATLDDPNDAEVFAGFGRSLRALNKSSESIRAFQNATVLDPKNPSHRYNLGLSYKAAGDNESAVEAFKKAIKLQPRDAESHYEAGLAYLAIGDLKGAISQSIELDSLNQIMARLLSAQIRQAEKKQPRVESPRPKGIL